ncbi:ABC transporter ATP-binding protein [Aureimonas fodinaquatilis]|uniref:ABC transporter ATP-binding protein n=1 Tax=Aureimonas fodinaquatilis TaxID=2565783 RepID=UPI001FE8D3D9|nr:ABC transporter ATP-binding protein [Aureimonas fodinaquatilis]
MQPSATPLLEGRSLTRRFGGVTALTDYSVTVGPGELLGLIGPNGAGKTTAFNLLTGVLKPTDGQVLSEGVQLTGKKPEEYARAGIARTFQNIRLFPELSVLENAAAGCAMRRGPGWLATMAGLPSAARAENDIHEIAARQLAEVGLADIADHKAGSLPYGHQRKLEIARALATEPKVLLLDEPAAGMNPSETAALVDMIAGLHERLKISIILVEHDMRLVMRLCQRIQVLDRGKLIAEGAPADIRANEAVVTAYLGTRRERAHA